MNTTNTQIRNKLEKKKKQLLMNKCEQNHRKMNRVTWPSGLRRCVQVAVFERGRGFKSHSYQIFLAFFSQGFFSLFFLF